MELLHGKEHFIMTALFFIQEIINSSHTWLNFLPIQTLVISYSLIKCINVFIISILIKQETISNILYLVFDIWFIAITVYTPAVKAWDLLAYNTFPFFFSLKNTADIASKIISYPHILKKEYAAFVWYYWFKGLKE